MKRYRFELIYLVIFVLVMLYETTYPEIRFVVKPLIVGSLLLWYYFTNGSPRKPIVLWALVFALLGDVFLMFSSETFFLSGIGAFLVMQVCYSLYFKRYFVKPAGGKLILSLGVVAISIGFLALFYDKLGAFLVPVVIYALAITVMVLLGVNQSLSSWIAIGAVFFLVSDLALAYAKFIDKNLDLGVLVISTYMAAQYFIVKGALEGES